MSATLDKIKAEVKTLNPNELQQVRDLVNSLLSPADEAAEDEFERELMAEGSLGEVKPLPADDPEFYAYKPVTVTGKPISETIIEERR